MNRRIKKRGYAGTKEQGLWQYEKEHRELSRYAAGQGMVLMKNENQILPVKAGSKVALYGAGAVETVKGGTGSGDVNERETVNIYQGIKERGYDITNEGWLKDFRRRFVKARLDWKAAVCQRAEEIAREREEKAIQIDDFAPLEEAYFSMNFQYPAGDEDIEKYVDDQTEIALFVLSRISGEGADRKNIPGDYLLSEEEKALLDKVTKYYPHVVLILNTGGVVDLGFVDEYENIDGILYMSQAGMEGGRAVADILSGDVSPSGKLTSSWAYRYEDYPGADMFCAPENVYDEYYKEGIFVGYRYFDTFDRQVRYSFGYGLSYTEFAIGDVYAEKTGNGSVKVHFNVTNTGKQYCGKEVIQIYVSRPQDKHCSEYRSLAGFAKTKLLKPGESQHLSVVIPLLELCIYDETIPGWILDEGFYALWVGDSLQGSKPGVVLDVDRTVLVCRTEHICPLKKKLEEICPKREMLLGKQKAWRESAKKSKIPVFSLDTMEIVEQTIDYNAEDFVLSGKEMQLVENLTTEQLIALATGAVTEGQAENIGNAGLTIPGTAGDTSFAAIEQNIASIILADGPAGIRANQSYEVKNGEIVKSDVWESLEGGLFAETKERTGEVYYIYCTSIPVGTLLAQTWDTELVYRLGRMIGTEMLELGITLWLAPGMNIHRNPLCGRNFEYYSEDPFVSGKMAAAMTKGVQSCGGVGTTLKHCACNNREDARMGSDSVVSERALRQIYLKGFEIAIKESQPFGVMTSYNFVNGVHSANNYDLCTKVIRREWDFRGVIMTDWYTTMPLPEEYPLNATAPGCISAGNDLIMPGMPHDHICLRAAMEKKEITMEQLRLAVAHLVSVIWRSARYEE